MDQLTGACWEDLVRVLWIQTCIVEGEIEKAEATAEPEVEAEAANGDTIRSDEQESDVVTTPKHTADQVELSRLQTISLDFI